MTQFLKRIAIVTLTVLMCLTGLNTQVKAASPTDGDAYAVLTSDGDLIFFRSTTRYEEKDDEEQTVTDINGKSYTGIVFEDVENGLDNSGLMDHFRYAVEKIYVADNTTIKLKQALSMFSEMRGLKQFNSKGFDTSEITDLRSMFYACTGIEELDLSHFDTSKVTTMSYMFESCVSLKKLDISSFDTSSVEEMWGMFYGVTSLEEIKLGKKFTKWYEGGSLYDGRWTNGTVTKTYDELWQEYPSHASEWAGTWTVIVDKIEVLHLESLVLQVDQQEQINWGREPYGSRVNRNLTWKSADESIATVNAEGVVTGKKIGLTTITATATDGTNVSGTCQVRVVDGEAMAVLQADGELVFIRSYDHPYYYYDDMEITDINGKVFKGYVFTDVEGEWGHDWTDDRYCERVKKVSVAENTTIYLSDLQNFFVFCSNMVEADLRGFNTEMVRYFAHMFAGCTSLEKLDLSTFTITKDADYLYNMFGECDSLTEVVLGPGIEYWDERGRLPRGKWSHGSVSLSPEELCQQYPLHASEWAGTWTRKIVKATSIAFAQDEYEGYCPNIGIYVDLIMNPEDATSPLEWSSSDESIAEVYSTGMVVGNNPGTVTITVKTTDGTNLTATCKVNIIEWEEPVHVDITGFKFTKKDYEVAVNSWIQLEYEITPEGADVYELIWESSDESIAEVYGGRVYPNKEGKVTITARNEDGTIKDTCTVKVTESEHYAFRVFGANRYKTSMAIAEAYRDWFTDRKVDNVILACGSNFADALAGSYLSAVKYAPIIIINDDNIDRVKEYVKNSVEKDGTVYILGGNVAVSEKVEKEMKKVANNVKRLAGNNRYATNLEILKEAGMSSDAILVATGNNFADSLSASATGLPMLLVKDSLNDDQKAFLKRNKGKKIYILGGTGVVSASVESRLKKYGDVERVAGDNRFETSVMIAEKFFDSPYYAMFAYSNDYPDGLCGGPIGYVLGSPLILTRSDKLDQATKYCKGKGIQDAIVFGGEARLTNNNVKTLLNNKSIKFEEYEYKGK